MPTASKHPERHADPAHRCRGDRRCALHTMGRLHTPRRARREVLRPMSDRDRLATTRGNTMSDNKYDHCHSAEVVIDEYLNALGKIRVQWVLSGDEWVLRIGSTNE